MHRNASHGIKTWASTARRMSQGSVTEGGTSSSKDEEKQTDGRGPEETTPPPNSEEGAGPGKYSYFRKGYTSEIFKIQLLNIPERIGYQVNILILRVITIGSSDPIKDMHSHIKNALSIKSRSKILTVKYC